MSNYTLRQALQMCRDYLSCIPESSAGGDDEAVRMARIAKDALAKTDDKAQPVAYRYRFAGAQGDVWLWDTPRWQQQNPVEVMPVYAAPQPPAEQGAESVDYPPLPEPLVRIDQSDDEMWGELQEHAWDSDFTLKLNDPLFTADQMRAYVDTDRVARGGARSTQLLDQIRRQRVRGQGGAA